MKLISKTEIKINYWNEWKESTILYKYEAPNRANMIASFSYCSIPSRDDTGVGSLYRLGLLTFSNQMVESLCKTVVAVWNPKENGTTDRIL